MPDINLKQYYDSFLAYLATVTNRTDFVFIMVTLVIVILLLAVINTIKRRHLKEASVQMRIINNLIDTIQAPKALEDNLKELLILFHPYVRADTFSFYVHDEKKGEYILKAVNNKLVGIHEISPSYSGLSQYKNETYFPPLSVSSTPFPHKSSIIKDGAVSLLAVPVKGKKGIIYIGPVTQVPYKTRNELDLLGNKIAPFLEMLLSTEDLKNQVKIVVASGKAMQSISSIVSNDDSILYTIAGVSMKAAGAAGVLFLRKDGQQYITLAPAGIACNIESKFSQDNDVHALFEGMLGNYSLLTLKRGEKDFLKLPSYITDQGVGMLVLVNISHELINGMAVFFYQSTFDMERFHLAALSILENKIIDIMVNRTKIKETSAYFINILKALADMVDNQNPYSTGYSELMFRYSVIIAKEMNLEKQQIKDIGQAAYLSNIGLLCLSGDLLRKEGKYTENEYEMMKLHSDVSASIIETTIGNNIIASYIRHHHERIDGYGYPAGLKGEEIPVGSRILAVVQTFLAKISGRIDREPLPFNKAIDMLESASRTQLDPASVDALTGWFRKKQSNPAYLGRSIGFCWEMKCPPENICSSCPAYNKKTTNCWEIRGTNCMQHGSSCDTCYVHTEFTGRKQG